MSTLTISRSIAGLSTMIDVHGSNEDRGKIAEEPSQVSKNEFKGKCRVKVKKTKQSPKSVHNANTQKQERRPCYKSNACCLLTIAFQRFRKTEFPSHFTQSLLCFRAPAHLSVLHAVARIASNLSLWYIKLTNKTRSVLAKGLGWLFLKAQS